MKAVIAFSVVVALGVAVGAVASSPTEAPVSSNKQAVIEHQFAAPPNAAPPAPKRPRFVPPLDPPRPHIPLKRVATTEVQAPVSRAVFVATSEWIDVTGALQLVVYGGAHAGSGAIYVWISNLETGLDVAGTSMFVSRAAGPLTLTGVSGDTVSFDGPEGNGTFDLATHEFRY
jgi:hypothetical protein